MDGFVFYRSYWEAIDCLPDDVSKCNIIKTICEYSLDGIEPNLEGIEKSIWTLIKPTLESSIKRYKSSVENGKKGGAPKGNQNAKRKTTQEQPNNNLNTTQEQPKNNLNKDKDKDKDKDIDKDMDVRFQMLMKMFDTPHYSTNNNLKLWTTLTETDKKYAFERGEKYIEWEKSRGKKKSNLHFYLKDEKWSWDLTIKNKKNKLSNEELPDNLKEWVI